MGRWSDRAANLKTGDYVCANSAISAKRSETELKSGANGTNGTVAKSPDPHDGDIAERAAIIEFEAGLPRHVADGLATFLNAERPPDMSAARWNALADDAGRFADMWATEAYALGWTDVELWGCSPGLAPRLDRDGVVMALRGRPVAELAADRIGIQASSGMLWWRRGKQQLGAVTLWEALGGSNLTAK